MTANSPVWRKLFPDEPHHIAAFHRAVRERVGPASVLLDVGCGDNAAFDDLRGQGAAVWGADFQRHPHLVEPGFFRLLGEDGSIPFADESFDVITCVWVLEHVQDPKGFLVEVRRVLRPGGVFLAHSISGDHYVTWIRRALQLLPLRWTQHLVERLYGRAPHDTFPTWYRLNTRRQLDREAQQVGLAVVRMERFADPGYFSFHRWAFEAAIVTDWVMERLFGCGRIYFWAALTHGEGGRAKAREAA